MKKKKILIVDDDFFNQEVLKAMLEEFDVDTVVLENGQKAVEYVMDGKNIDLILMDLHMPVLDGEKATQEIRKYEVLLNLQRIPIIIVSASIDEADKNRFMKSGVDETIMKPIKMDKLELLLNKLIFNRSVIIYDIEKTSKKLMLPVEVIKDLLQKFILGLDDELMIMQRKVQEKDFKSLRELAHKLKGRSGNLQVLSMHEIFAQIEKDAKEEKECEYESLIEKILKLNSELKKI